jgi:hypothetical protein
MMVYRSGLAGPKLNAFPLSQTSIVKVHSVSEPLYKLTERDLMSKAAHESRHSMPIFIETFLEHHATEYKPLYGKQED